MNRIKQHKINFEEERERSIQKNLSYIDRTFQTLEEQKQVCLQQNELEPSAVILCPTVGILVPDPIQTSVDHLSLY